MKKTLLILITLISVAAEAAPTRFTITNRVTGQRFSPEVEDGVFVHQPEFGKKKRSELCANVAKEEESLILSRKAEKNEAGEDVEICEVDDHFTIVATDLTAERAAKETEETAKKTERDALKLLEGKTSFSNAERDRILLYLLKEKLKNEPDAAAIRPRAR